MSIDQERAAELKQSSLESADNDPMLQAYGRFWAPYAERAVTALESQAKSLERIARDTEFIRDYK
jgi:hypothetical protein